MSDAEEVVNAKKRRMVRVRGPKRGRGIKETIAENVYYFNHDDSEVRDKAKKLVEEVPTMSQLLQVHITADHIFEAKLIQSVILLAIH